MRLVIALVLFFKLALAATDVTVTVHYPGSRQMFLRGSACGLNWSSGVKMESSQANKWQTVLKCTDAEIKSNALEVKALIGDSDWMVGSNHHVRFSNGTTTFDEFYPWFYTYKGTTTVIKNVASSELGNKRDVIVYMPPSFKENTLKRYSNVMVMHDGQNLFDPRTSAFGCWNAQDALDSSVVSGLSDEILVVGPYNTAARIDEYTYVYDESEQAGGKGDLYLDWIESTLLPLISSSSEYRADIKRETLGILGSSLGGLISCYAGWTRASVYGKVGCMSSSFWWADQDFEMKMMPAHAVPAAPHPHIYMDSGTAGSLGGEAQCAKYTAEIYDIMAADSFKPSVEIMKYVDQGGEHNEASWGNRFYIPVQYLYPSTTV